MNSTAPGDGLSARPAGRFATAVSSAAVATAVTLPFLLALPTHYDPERPWWNAGLWALMAAILLGVQFAASRMASLAYGARLAGAFGALYLVLALLNFTSVEHYRFDQAVTDLGLLYLIFLGAAIAARVAAPVGRAVLALLALALFLAALVQAVHQHTFGFAIGPDGYRAILQSNAGEALEFAGHYLGAGAIAAASVALVAAIAMAPGILRMRVPGEGFAWGGVFALAAIAVLAGNAGPVGQRLQGFSEAIDYAGEIWEYRAVREARRTRGEDLRVAQHGPLAGQPQIYVFAIGESLTRNHMSLYGYWRDTTPALARLAAEMAVFTDVVSPHSHTDQSLELVLTLANRANGLRYTDATNYSLIEILRAAGFATWWISNQNSFGPWDNKTAALASGAEHVHYTGARSGRMVLGPYDEALLEPFAAALRDPAPRKAIFLHFLGSHWEYARRYPPQADVFREPPGPAEIGALSAAHRKLRLINEYDNSVRYHDQLAAKVVEMLRATRRAAVLTLFADHGESVYGRKGHYWREFTRDHVEVPLLLWFSPEYARLAGDVVARARAGARRPFALEDLPHLVAEIAALRSPVFETQRSPISSAYRTPRARTLFEGTLIYEEADEAAFNARRALARLAAANPGLRASLWAHRVDTLGKMREVAPLFAGAEIDVVFDAERGVLMVNHPPEPPSGLTLETLLDYSNRLNPDLALWLDLKNLNETNAARVLEELNRLDARYAIRARALVETGHTGPAAAALRQAGYRSSYYLPTALVAQSAGAEPGVNCYGAQEVQRAVVARRFAAISYDWRGRRWVERCLGGFVRQRGLRSYAWDLEPVLSDVRAHEALDDERLRGYASRAAVLLPYRTLFDDTR